MDCYRDRHSTSGAKSDAGDAQVLADMVRTDRHNHRLVAGDSQEVEAIKVLARAHQSMVWSRGRQTNLLRSTLREFYSTRRSGGASSAATLPSSSTQLASSARRVTPFSPDEVTKLLDGAGTLRLGAFYVAMAVGLRSVCGRARPSVCWGDVDLTEGIVHVRRALERRDGEFVFKETRSRTSRRSIPLPGVCVDALRAHRLRQLEERLPPTPNGRTAISCSPLRPVSPSIAAKCPANSVCCKNKPALPIVARTTAGAPLPASSSPKACRPAW